MKNIEIKTDMNRYGLYTYITLPLFILSIGVFAQGFDTIEVVAALWISYIFLQCSYRYYLYRKAYYYNLPKPEIGDIALASIFKNDLTNRQLKMYFVFATIFYVLIICLSYYEYTNK